MSCVSMMDILVYVDLLNYIDPKKEGKKRKRDNFVSEETMELKEKETQFLFLLN